MLTNKYNLPSPIPEIIMEGGHEPVPNRYSVTDLLGPPLIRTLKHKHHHEIANDVSDYLWMLLGTSLDKLLTDNLMDHQAQNKMEYEVEGNTIVGIADVMRDNTIEDWKVTSVNTLSNTARIQEWSHQLNMYAWLWDMTKDPKDVEFTQIKIHAYLRDWVAVKANDPKYPRCQLHTLNLTPMLLSPKGREELVLERLTDHLENPTRECTGFEAGVDNEKWEKPTTYAVKKQGQANACRGTAKLETKEDAEKWIVGQKKPAEYYIETRPGSCFRCDNYCSVSNFCPYYEGE